jgi:hypothetical protein
MPNLKYFDESSNTWQPLIVGAKGETGDTGPEGPQGPAGLGTVAVTAPITNTGTSTDAVIGLGTVGVANGGTGATTLTNNGYLKGAGTSAITSQVGIPAADITSGSFAYARLPAGSVIQVVQGRTTTQVNNATSTFANTGLSASITRRLSNSLILVVVNQAAFKGSGNTENQFIFRILRGGTTIYTSSGLLRTASSLEINTVITTSILNNPGTTLSQTYTTQFRNGANANQVIAQLNSEPSVMTLREIAT